MILHLHEPAVDAYHSHYHAMSLTITNVSDLVVLDRPSIMTVCVSMNDIVIFGCATIACSARIVALSDDSLFAALMKYAQTTKVICRHLFFSFLQPHDSASRCTLALMMGWVLTASRGPSLTVMS